MDGDGVAMRERMGERRGRGGGGGEGGGGGKRVGLEGMKERVAAAYCRDDGEWAVGE